MPTRLSNEDPVHRARPAERFPLSYHVTVMIGIQANEIVFHHRMCYDFQTGRMLWWILSLQKQGLL